MLYSLSLITQNETMRSVLSRVDTIAASDSSVLLIGETGVGKELFAEYIHRTSHRGDHPLVKVGLAALPHELLESELFGHERGAFTSAMAEKKGLFELSDGGSVFLDDIDDFPFPLQSKLLRVLESHEVLRVGGAAPIPIDIRLITATKVELKELVQRGIFRADLYYRINVVPIIIPPLRDRRDDIPLRVEHFLDRFAPDKQLSVGESAQRLLVNYPWPGNVRELRNVVQRLALFAKDVIQEEDLPTELRDHDAMQLLIKSCQQCLVNDGMSFDQVVACLESNLLQEALKQSDGNKTQAARSLGMNLSTLRDKLKKYNLDDPGQ